MENDFTSGQLIKQINDAVERRANNLLRENDLTMVQMWVLISLNRKADKTYSLKELERILGVAQSTCAGIISRLSLKGLVDCFSDTTDKRMKLVRITEAGEICCTKANRNIHDIEDLMFQDVTVQEQKLFQAVLLKVYGNVK